MILDAHTHHVDRADNAIVCVEPDSVNAIAASHPGIRLSTGIHPWNTETANDTLLEQLRSAASSPAVAAIGEAGLDRKRGAALERQIELFNAQAILAETLGKPLIIHCVKAGAELLALNKKLKPSVPWIIHGFRGNKTEARQMLDKGMYLSLGEHFNIESAVDIPIDRLLVETDTSQLPVDSIIERIAALRGITPAELSEQIAHTCATLFSGPSLTVPHRPTTY